MRHGVFSGVITRARRWWGDFAPPLLAAYSSVDCWRYRSRVRPVLVRFSMFRLEFCLFDLNFSDDRLDDSVCVACWVRVDCSVACRPRLGVCGSCVCSGRRPLWREAFWITLAAGNYCNCVLGVVFVLSCCRQARWPWVQFVYLPPDRVCTRSLLSARYYRAAALPNRVQLTSIISINGEPV